MILRRQLYEICITDAGEGSYSHCGPPDKNSPHRLSPLWCWGNHPPGSELSSPVNRTQVGHSHSYWSFIFIDNRTHSYSLRVKSRNGVNTPQGSSARQAVRSSPYQLYQQTRTWMWPLTVGVSHDIKVCTRSQTSCCSNGPRPPKLLVDQCNPTSHSFAEFTSVLKPMMGTECLKRSNT